jgi:hypothetical protein
MVGRKKCHAGVSTTWKFTFGLYERILFIWEQTATCATYSINWLVFITEMGRKKCHAVVWLLKTVVLKLFFVLGCVPYEGTDLEFPPLLLLTEGALCLLHPSNLPLLPLYLTWRNVSFVYNSLQGIAVEDTYQIRSRPLVPNSFRLVCGDVWEGVLALSVCLWFHFLLFWLGKVMSPIGFYNVKFMNRCMCGW